jgi:hypothetical protein
MCKICRLLYRAVPIRWFRSQLVSRHFASCRSCREEFAVEESLTELAHLSEWVTSEPSLWPEIKEKLAASRPSIGLSWKQTVFPPFRIWRWAAAGAGLALLLLTIFLLLPSKQRESRPTPPAQPSSSRLSRIAVKHAEVRGKKARYLIYQTEKASFIWFDESKKTGG